MSDRGHPATILNRTLVLHSLAKILRGQSGGGLALVASAGGHVAVPVVLRLWELDAATGKVTFADNANRIMGFASGQGLDEAVLTEWGQALAEGEPFETELRLRRAGGAWRLHLVRMAPQRNEGGVITRWLGSALDIEDRMQSQP